MLKRHWKIIFILLSQCADLLALIGAYYAVHLLNDALDMYVHHHFGVVARLAFVFGASFILFSAMFGYHRGMFRLNFRKHIGMAAKAYLLSIVVTVLFAEFIAGPVAIRRALVVLSLAFPPLFLSVKIFLRSVNKRMQAKGYGIHHVLIAGSDASSHHIYELFSSMPELGYSVHGFIMQEKNDAADVHPQYLLSELKDVIRRHGIDRIFIPSTDLIADGYSSLKTICREQQIKLKVLSSQSEELLRFSKVHDFGGITLTAPPRKGVTLLKLAAKRIFDIVGSAIVIALLSPVFLITMLLVIAEDGFPVFYLQKRVSIRNGRSFNFIKFRSMVRGAEKRLDQLRVLNESDGGLFKMKADPRVTKIGRYLRKFSIDELPQLFNVLKGDMSLVGPRPLSTLDLERLDVSEDFWDAVKDRGSVKAGMTGLWQISGRSDIKFNEMLLLDLYYVENHSILFDLEILFETIPTVLFGKGAY